MPQKHPPATTAVCWPETVASLASCAGAGTAAAAPALALQAVAPMSSPRESRTDLSDGLDMLLSPCSKYEGRVLLDWSCREQEKLQDRRQEAGTTKGAKVHEGKPYRDNFLLAFSPSVRQ